jgi:hypothetical protein
MMRRYAVWTWLKGLPGLLTIRATLFVGFGLIFALWLMSAVDLVRRLDEVEMRAVEVGRRLSNTEDLLSSLRAQVLLASVYLRDALLDTPETAGEYRRQLQQIRKGIDHALAAYVPVVDSPGERSTFSQLRSEVEDFWETVLPVLSWDSGRRAIEARAVLRGRIIPKRELIIRISERVQALNRAASEEQQSPWPFSSPAMPAASSAESSRASAASSGCRRSWSAPRRRSAARLRGNCTTRLGRN